MNGNTFGLYIPPISIHPRLMDKTEMHRDRIIALYKIDVRYSDPAPWHRVWLQRTLIRNTNGFPLTFKCSEPLLRLSEPEKLEVIEAKLKDGRKRRVTPLRRVAVFEWRDKISDTISIDYVPIIRDAGHYSAYPYESREHAEARIKYNEKQRKKWEEFLRKNVARLTEVLENDLAYIEGRLDDSEIVESITNYYTEYFLGEQ